MLVFPIVGHKHYFRRTLQNDTILLEITIQDIEAARQGRENPPSVFSHTTPACVATERITGSRWKTVGATMLLEERPPFRYGLLSPSLQQAVQKFLAGEEMQPCSQTLHLTPLKQRPDTYQMPEKS